MRTLLKIVAVFLVLALIVWYPRATHLCGHTESVAWASISPDAKHIASCSVDDRTVRIWDVAKRKQLAVFAKSAAETFEFSPDGKILAIGSKDPAIVLWNIADGKEWLRLQGHKDAVLSFAFSPDGKTLASHSNDKEVKTWDLTTAKERYTFQPQLSYTTSIAYSPDGTLLACGGWDDSRGTIIQLRDAKTGAEIRSLSKPDWRVFKLLFSPDGTTLCAADQSTLALWDVASGKQRECECPEWLYNDDDDIEMLAFSPDSRTLAVGHSEAIGLWDVASGESTTHFTRNGRNPYLGFSDRFFLDPEERRPPRLAAAVFNPNGDLMVVGLRHETIAFWRLTSVRLKK